MIQSSRNVMLYGIYKKSDMTFNQDEFMSGIKKGLVKLAVPNVSELCVIEISGDAYRYPAIRNSLDELLYFDQNNKLYINQK